MGPYDFTHKKYYDLKAGHVAELSNPSIERKKPGTLSFPMQGGRLDCRVITVKDGTVAGMFTVYNFPSEGICEFEVLSGKEWRNPEPNPGRCKGWGVGNEEQNARRLAQLLAQTLKEGEIVISNVRSGSLAQKQALSKNDIILKINGQAVFNISQAVNLMLKADEKIEMLIKRDGQEKLVTFSKHFAEPLGLQITYRAIRSQQPAASVDAAGMTSAAPLIPPVQDEAIVDGASGSGK
jgi:membrane-associated protease RseP (regulator of RpoE activity)